MPTNAQVKFTPGVLPEGFCHTTWQKTFNTWVSLLRGYLPGNFSTFNFGSAEPAAEDRDKPWLRLDGSGTPLGWYIYNNGEWVLASKHPLRPGMIIQYYGLDTDVPTLDGGTIANPFWRLCDGTNGTPDLRNRFIVGAGLDYSLGDVGGESTHVLTTAEGASEEHTHWFGYAPGSSSNTYLVGVAESSGETVASQSVWRVDGESSNSFQNVTLMNLHTLGIREGISVPVAHENRPPYLALWMIMRTTRDY